MPVAAAASSCASSRHRAKLGALPSAETVALVFAHRLQYIYQIVAVALAQLPDALVGLLLDTLLGTLVGFLLGTN